MEDILLRLILLGFLAWLAFYLIPMEAHVKKIAVAVVIIIAVMIALPLLRALIASVV